MQTGFGALEQTLKESAARGDFTPGLDYFKIADGESIFVRFITDDIITGDFAVNVRCANGKYQDFLVPDPSQNLVNRYVQPGGWDGKIVKRTIGVGVARRQKMVQPTPGSDSRPTFELEDDTYQRPDGLWARKFIVFKQGHNNFWDQMVGFFGMYQTIMDRDYRITRRGEKLETKYTIVPVDPTPNDPLRDPKVVTEYYGYGRPWDNNADDRYMYCPQTAKEFADDYASERRIKFWLVGEQQQQQTQATGGPPQIPIPGQPVPSTPAATAPAAPVANAAPPTPGWGNGATEAQDGAGEFHPATTHNPEPAPSAPPAIPMPGAPAPAAPAPETQVAPAEDQSFESLRARMQGHAKQAAAEQQQTT